MLKPKILVIVGPTASGKTSLSIKLAKKLDGEVISADSRQVYRGLDLGTGKVTQSEMDGVHHHLLDVVDPNTVYTVADFVRDGRKTIDTIVARGKTSGKPKLPIIVGGTFLYVDALLGKISTPGVLPNATLRATLEKMSTQELFEMLAEKDPKRAETIDKDNPRRLIRALEIIEAVGIVPETRKDELYDALTIGISISKETLQQNIHARFVDRLAQGMLEEVIELHKNGLSYERLTELGIEYKYISEYLQDKISKEEMFRLIETKSIQYAKRQMTWLKRDEDIVWVEPSEVKEIEMKVEGFLK